MWKCKCTGSSEYRGSLSYKRRHGVGAVHILFVERTAAAACYKAQTKLRNTHGQAQLFIRKASKRAQEETEAATAQEELVQEEPEAVTAQEEPAQEEPEKVQVQGELAEEQPEALAPEEDSSQKEAETVQAKGELVPEEPEAAQGQEEPEDKSE